MTGKELLNVLLIESDQRKATAVVSALDHKHYNITHVSAGGISLLKQVEAQSPDLIIMDVESPDRDVVESLNHISASNPKPVVLFSENKEPEMIQALVKSGVSAYVVGDVDSDRVKSAIELAMARFAEYQQLKDELKATQNKLSVQKDIDRAKFWLMETKHLSENEAYHLIRKMAMDNSQKIEDVAKNMLSIASMLEQ